MNSYKENGWEVVLLPEKLLSRHCAELSLAFEENISKGNVKLIVDASNLTLINSHGIGLLLKELLRLQDIGGDMRIRNLNGEPLNFFKKAELEDIFSIEDYPGSLDVKNRRVAEMRCSLEVSLEREK